MRENLFQILFDAVKILPIFMGSNGTLRVYDYPITQPDGYPFASIVSQSLDSSIYDTRRGLRLYNFLISVIGEKFGEQGGFTQAKALQVMRKTEDDIVSMIDTDSRLGGAGLGVIWTKPTRATYGYTDGNSRVVLEISVQFQVAVDINLGN